MKPIALLLSFLMACVCAHAEQYDKLARHLEGLTSMQAKELGNSYARAEDWGNALFCYQTVISRYRPGQSSKEEATAAGSAWNNLGYVYLYGRSDYSQAFQAYLHSQEIAQQVGDTEMLPYVDLNLANVYALYEDYDNMVRHYRRAFSSATELGLDEVAATALSGLVIHAMANHTPQLARSEVRQFDKLSPGAATPGLAHARTLSEAFKALDQGNTDRALELLARIEKMDNNVLTPERLKGKCILLRAQLMRGQGKLKESVDLLRSVTPNRLPDDIRVGFLEAESEILAAMGHPDSALVAHNMALRINDSLYRTQTYGKIRDLRGDWEARRAAEQLELSDQRRATAWMWVWVSALVAAVIALLAVQIVVKNRRLRQSNQALYQRVNEANRQYEAMHRQLEPKPEPPADGAAATEEEASASKVDRELLARVTAAFADEQAISAADFTIDRLAKMIGSNSTYVSRVVNAGTGKNFATLLGEARVRLACRRLNDEAYSQFTIEAIAGGLGFRSRTNFIAVFKRATGLTPSEYKKIARASGGAASA